MMAAESVAVDMGTSCSNGRLPRTYAMIRAAYNAQDEQVCAILHTLAIIVVVLASPSNREVWRI